MKLDVIAQNREKKGSMELPSQFSTPVRADIIKRAVESEQNAARQPYGAKPTAGRRHSAYVSKRRHDYKSTYGIGQSRTPRKVMSRSGTRMNWKGAVAPQAVGGRQAHPPKAEKIWITKVNKKEYAMALRSAISATLSKDLAAARGHCVPDSYPFILDPGFDQLAKTKDVKAYLESLGLTEDLARGRDKKVRAGKGKTRGRKYKRKKSALIVTSQDCPVSKAARGIPGVDVLLVDKLTVHALAPGAMPGRLTLWTKGAVERIAKEGLFA